MRKDCGTLSLAIHVVLILSLAVWTVRTPPSVPLDVVKLAPAPTFRFRHLVYTTQDPAGGSGGARAPLPVTRGRLPKPAPRLFVPPQAIVENTSPRLVLEPAILFAQDSIRIDAPQFGDPQALPGPPSQGSGHGGGIGNHRGRGVGSGQGDGYGPGDGGRGLSGMHLAGPVIPPQLIARVEPEFSEEARKARLEGTVVLQADIDIDGTARNIRIVRQLGLGLDESAAAAVTRWRFRPATRGGRPFVMQAVIEVNFRLL